MLSAQCQRLSLPPVLVFIISIPTRGFHDWSIPDSRAGHRVPVQASDHAVRLQARSLRNDERILDAAVRLAAQEGWPELLPARVAQAAGLSRSAVSDRFADRSALAAWAWSEALASVVRQALQSLVRLVPDLGRPGTGHDAVDSSDLGRAMEAFVEPDEAMRAAAELLVVSSFDPALHEAVRGTLGSQLDAWLTPVPRRVSKSNAARRAFLVIVALGGLLEARRREGAPLSLESEWDRIATALHAPDSIRTVPEVHFEHWDGSFDFDTGDALLDRLLEATRDEVGRKGYDATTIDSIAKAAGRTKGLVFSRYPSKKELLNDTTARYTKAMFDLNEQAFATLLDGLSPGVAEAAVYREYMRPGRAHLHVFALEQYRLAWHDAEMRHAIAAAMAEVIETRLQSDHSRSLRQWEAFNFIGASQGVGVMLLASCCPEAWTLPYQVMTVPLND